MKVKNVTNGPKRLNSTPPVVLQADEERDVEISDAELKVAKATEWFAFGRAATKDDAKD